jgi:hypothetical protein
MQKITGYIRAYLSQLNKVYFAFVTAFTAVLIYLNYQHGTDIYAGLKNIFPFPFLTLHFLLYLLSFGIAYAAYAVFEKKNYFSSGIFTGFIFLAAGLFAIKISINVRLSADNELSHVWNNILRWPLAFVIMLSLLLFIWKFFQPKEKFYGISTENIEWKPYLLMLLMMVPLITVASTQADFLASYPKMKMILPLPETSNSFLYKLLFEVSYGSDFFTIELFFRGFLILGFMKWVGKDAIIPMACFYCCIHFGKPLGECISSYFGGILLGIIVFNTRSIWGGLLVHLGIAWLMELGAYLGHQYY